MKKLLESLTLKDSINNSKYDRWNSFDLCELIRVMMMNNFKVRNMIKSKRIYGFSDIDECKGNHSCHMNATCTNANGSYVCECQPGFNENGQSCIGEFNRFAINI